MDTLEGGLAFVLQSLGAEAGALLIGASNEEPSFAAERMWSPKLAAHSRELWTQAQAGTRGALVAPPVLAVVSQCDERVGLLCVALPERGDSCATRIDDLEAVARLLVNAAVAGARPSRPTLALIHHAADPQRAFLRLYEHAGWNMSDMARYLNCTRKALYLAAERYKVRVGRAR